MSVTFTFTDKHNDGVTPLGGDINEAWPEAALVSAPILANQTNLPVAYAHTNAKLKSFFIMATKDMTVYTNDVSGGSPQETIHLKANDPISWRLSASSIGAAASPFGGNVTVIYVTNTAAGELTIRSQSAV